MCLMTDKNREPPNEVMTFYKVIIQEGEVRKSPYYPIDYSVGAVVRALGSPDILKGRFSDFVYGGAIHVFTQKGCGEVRRALRELSERQSGDWWLTGFPIVISVKCRPEHFIAWGIVDEAAYSQVEVLD